MVLSSNILQLQLTALNVSLAEYFTLRKPFILLVPPPPVSDVTTELLDRLIRACSLREITGSEESPLEPELASEDNIPPSLELASKESIPLNFPFLSSFAVFSS